MGKSTAAAPLRVELGPTDSHPAGAHEGCAHQAIDHTHIHGMRFVSSTPTP